MLAGFLGVWMSSRKAGGDQRYHSLEHHMNKDVTRFLVLNKSAQNLKLFDL